MRLGTRLNGWAYLMLISIVLNVQTIFKYQLDPLAHRQTVDVPKFHKILDIQIQNGKPVVWVLVDPDSNRTGLTITMYTTGFPIQVVGDYIKTIQIDDFVAHYFKT